MHKHDTGLTKQYFAPDQIDVLLLNLNLRDKNNKSWNEQAGNYRQ
jgi:hypothetical protein